MGASITYPDGSVLTSSALTIAQINAIMQPLTCGMIGVADPTTTSRVRIEWPTVGAPFQEATEDICYLRCVPKDDPYDKIRDVFNLPLNDTDLNEQWNYTRAWSIRWCFYGPNSTDLARAIRSGLYQDYFVGALALSQLFPVSDFPQEVRAPELIDGQWFERVDLEVEMYEFVTENIDRQTILSVETLIEGNGGVLADFTVTAS